MALSQLPSEMKMIFVLLNNSSLFSVTMTCKDFYRIVYDSRTILKKYSLRIEGNGALKFYQNFGQNFSSVKFVGTKLSNSSRTGFSLDSIRNVAELVFHNCEGKGQAQFQLPALKKMDFRDTKSQKIVKYLQLVKIQELKIAVKVFHKNAFDENFLNWFYQQNLLETLHLDENSFSILFSKIVAAEVPFKLKRFSLMLKNRSKLPEDLGEQFTEFIKNQDEIEEICVTNTNFNQGYGSTRTPTSVESILEEFLVSTKSLKKLTIALPSVSLRNNFEASVNENVEIFVNRSKNYHSIVKFFPNLKEYEDENVAIEKFASIVKNLHTNCSDIRVLKMQMNNVVWLDNYGHYKFKKFINLKELHFIRITCSYASWCQIIENCPEIEKLSLHQFTLRDDSVKEMCHKWSNFKELVLGRGYYELDMFDHLNSSKSFRKLTIHQSTFTQANFENVNYQVQIYENWKKIWPKFKFDRADANLTFYGKDFIEGRNNIDFFNDQE